MRVGETPDFLQSIANHPRVYPHVSFAGCGVIDLSGIWPDCIALEFETGGWLFHRQEPDTYEVHTLFLPKSEGVREKSQQALRHMFEVAGARLILTQIATDLPHVRRLALAGGFEKFASKQAAYCKDSGPVDVDYYELTQEAWANKEQGKCQ